MGRSLKQTYIECGLQPGNVPRDPYLLLYLYAAEVFPMICAYVFWHGFFLLVQFSVAGNSISSALDCSPVFRPRGYGSSWTGTRNRHWCIRIRTNSRGRFRPGFLCKAESWNSVSSSRHICMAQLCCGTILPWTILPWFYIALNFRWTGLDYGSVKICSFLCSLEIQNSKKICQK